MSTSITHRSGTLFSASPPQILPRLIEGRSNSSELCRANGSDSILRKTSIARSTALSPEPRRRPVGGGAGDLEPHRQHPLGLDPDVEVGRLAGDREVADEAGVDQPVAAAVLALLRLLVADHAEPHPDPVLVAHRRGDDHHRRDRALHVVGAAPVEPVPLDPRLELLRPRRHHVEVPLEHHRRRVGGPTSAISTGSPRTSSASSRSPRLEPSPDETRRIPDRLARRSRTRSAFGECRVRCHRRRCEGSGVPPEFVAHLRRSLRHAAPLWGAGTGLHFRGFATFPRGTPEIPPRTHSGNPNPRSTSEASPGETCSLLTSAEPVGRWLRAGVGCPSERLPSEPGSIGRRARHRGGPVRRDTDPRPHHAPVPRRITPGRSPETPQPAPCLSSPASTPPLLVALPQPLFGVGQLLFERAGVEVARRRSASSTRSRARLPKICSQPWAWA